VEAADTGTASLVEAGVDDVLISPERRDMPFALPLPWETPVTHVYGQRLSGMTMGLRTELALAKAVDKGDLDEVAVHPLPAQEKILEAFDRLGFRFTRADLEYGRIHGVRQELPFYQEIEFYPPQQYAGSINEVELTFVADPEGVEVILEFDKRGGFLAPGRDSYGRFRVPHEEVESSDWSAVVDGWMREASGRYQALCSDGRGYAGQGYAGVGHAGPRFGGHGGYGGHGPGLGTMAAGVAGGVVGGMILGEVVEEAFEEDDGGDFEE
jgi:sporulation-control protein